MSRRSRARRSVRRAGWSRGSPTTSATSAPASGADGRAGSCAPRCAAARCRRRCRADTDFARHRCAAVYEQSWLACRLIAARAGQPGLVRFYRLGRRQPGHCRPQAVAAALRAVLHEIGRSVHRAVAGLPASRAAMAGDAADAGRHQRLPAASGRHPVLRPRACSCGSRPDSVVVYASDHAGSAAFDAAQPFPVLRHPTGLLVPTPAARRRAVAALRRARLHRGVVRRVGAARAAGTGAARGRGASGWSRPRTGTRWAGRCCPARAQAAAPDRRRLRRRHLPRRVHAAAHRAGLRAHPSSHG